MIKNQRKKIKLVNYAPFRNKHSAFVLIFNKLLQKCVKSIFYFSIDDFV